MPIKFCTDFQTQIGMQLRNHGYFSVYALYRHCGDSRRYYPPFLHHFRWWYKPSVELLDEALQIIANSEKDEEAKHWIREINKRIKNLQTRLSDRLVAEGILIKRKEKLFGIFTRHRYPSINPHYEIEIREEIHSILLRDKDPDERRALLISLVNACKILPVLFPNKSERKIAKKRAEAITSSDIIGKGIKEIINEVTAAVVFMIIHVAVL